MHKVDCLDLLLDGLVGDQGCFMRYERATELPVGDKRLGDSRSDIQKPFNVKSSCVGFSKIWLAISAHLHEYERSVTSIAVHSHGI